MEFIKVHDYWSYQLPEWDNYEKEVIDAELSQLDFVLVIQSRMTPEADKWVIEYKEGQFTIVNDLIHGCEIRTHDEELLPLAKALIKYLPL